MTRAEAQKRIDEIDAEMERGVSPSLAFVLCAEKLALGAMIYEAPRAPARDILSVPVAPRTIC